jgi:hypothetical protein
MAKIALWRLAEKVLQPDSKGFSRLVTKEEMVSQFPELEHKNGCSWGRSDGPLARKYVLKRVVKGHEVYGYQLAGFATQSDFKSIRADIKKQVSQLPCAVTGVSPADTEVARIECDHKNGRYDDDRLEEASSQYVTDFQPLHRNVNLIKRSHCKRCEQTGKRFDATTIGFSAPWTQGGPTRPDNPKGCVGCYWHDVKDFHAKISANYRYTQGRG